MRTADNKVLNRIPLNYETKDRDAIKDWIAGPPGHGAPLPAEATS